MSTKLPADLQGVLWNINIDKIDLKVDKSYIINQVLAYGAWHNLEWLFNNYQLDEIKETFISKPEKDYTAQCYNFTKNVLLNINIDLDVTKYVKSYPRNIGRQSN
jgi:hypothetical protein